MYIIIYSHIYPIHPLHAISPSDLPISVYLPMSERSRDQDAAGRRSLGLAALGEASDAVDRRAFG